MDKVESNSIEEALLKKESYFPDCPGCQVEKKKRSEPGLSYLNVFRIWIIVLVNALPISSLFPFLYFMVRDFKIADREEDVGFYAGFVGASFMFGRALTSIFWGVMADRYGRKPVIIIGTVSVIIFNTLFGLSVNYWMAITTRFLLGSLNGLLGPMKAYATEILNEEHHAIGMSAISTAWASGLIIGPALGGFLALPAEKYPSMIPSDSLFGRFPYFLPCVCICFFAVAVLIFSFSLPETLHRHHGKSKADVDSLDAIETASICLSDDQKSKASLLRNWPLMSSIIVYCMFSLHGMAFSEVFSLWAVSPQKLGGLSYTTELVGEVLAISGISLLAFQMFLYPIMEKALGTVQVCRFSGILTLPIVSSFPYIALLSGTTLFVVLNVASVAKSFLAASCITSLAILQNKAVGQEQRGAANGLSMTLMSICKTIGPAAGGALLSWAESRQDASFLPGTHMIFFILNVFVAIGVLMTFKPFLATRSLT